jgi:hypothetical protein
VSAWLLLCCGLSQPELLFLLLRDMLHCCQMLPQSNIALRFVCVLLGQA